MSKSMFCKYENRGNAVAEFTGIGAIGIGAAGLQLPVRKDPKGLELSLHRSALRNLGHLIRRLMRLCSQRMVPERSENRSMSGTQNPL